MKQRNRKGTRQSKGLMSGAQSEPMPETQAHSQPELITSSVSSTSSVAGSSSTSRNTRGPTRGLKLFRKFNGEPLPLDHNEFNQPIGDHAQDLSTYLGICARNCHRLPLVYNSWHCMPNERKIAEWEEARKRSARNTANRRKLKMGHNTGTVSFAIVREKKKRPNGTAPKRADFFVDTHTFQENGRPIDTASSEIISKLQQLQPSNVGQGISQNGIAQNDELAQVMGADKNGHVRLLGFGPTPSSLWGTTSQSDAIKRAEEARKAAEEGQRAAEKAKKAAEEDARESRELMASMKTKVDGLESIVKSLARKISKKRSKKKRKMGRNANALDDDA